MLRQFAVCALLVASFVASTPVFAASRGVYVKAEAVPATKMDADLNECIKQVLGYMNSPSSPVPPLQHPTTDQVLFRAFDMRGPRMAAKAEVRCMAEKGYVGIPLTLDESKTLSRSRGIPARDRWYDDFVTHDLSGRISIARTTQAALEH